MTLNQAVMLLETVEAGTHRLAAYVVLSRVTPRPARAAASWNCPLRRSRRSAHHARQAAERLAAGEMWEEHDLVFCRQDGTPLDRWHVRKEFQKITKAARLGGSGRPANYGTRSCPSSAHDVRLEDISDLMGHSSTLVTETVYRHEIRPALTKGATAMNRILKAN